MENMIFLNLTVEASFLSQTQNRISEKERLDGFKSEKVSMLHQCSQSWRDDTQYTGKMNLADLSRGGTFKQKALVSNKRNDKVDV